MRLRRAAVIAGAALLVAAAPAAAAPHMVGMEDERLLLEHPGRAATVTAEWVASGVDVVRLHARWGAIAPAGRRKPSGFNGNDMRDRRYDWAALDHAVNVVHTAGLKLMLTITGPGPLWSSRVPSRGNPRYKPNPQSFGAFARAVATRYGDRVDMYLVYNEPNIPGWLDPQLECRRKVCTPVAPHVYRELLRSAYSAIKAVDAGAQVIAGELAPVGREPRTPRSTIPPLTFLRAMACLDERYRPLPRKGGCARFRPVRADAFGHHPHGVRAGPDEPSQNPRWAKIADLPRLFSVLDRITRTGRFVAPRGRFDLHLTEFGYQTSPPDHAIGVSLEKQAKWLQQAAYLAWRLPRVRSLVHYQWEDEPVRFRRPGLTAYAGWQSGLRFVNGRPKPAMEGFIAPFVVDGDRFWGQVRPGGAHRVTILRRGLDGAFAAVGKAVTDDAGFWTQTLPGAGPGDYRFSWDDPAQPAQQRSSRTVRVTR